MHPVLAFLLRAALFLLSVVFFLASKSPTLFIGAALGTYLTEKKWDFLWSDALLWARVWFVISVILWAALHVTRRWWEKKKQLSGVHLNILVGFLGLAARFVADYHGRSKQARQHRNEELAQQMASYMTRSYPNVKDVRAVVYKTSPDGSQMEPLRWDGPPGRAPSGPFVRGDGGRGDKAFEFIESNQGPKLVEDTKNADPGWQGSGSGYRSFIAAPIVNTAGHLGMLTIDAPKAKAFTPEEKEVVALAANVLGIAFSTTKGK